MIFVDVFDGLQNAHLVAVLLGGLDQRLHVLGEATSTIATAGVKELATDAGIASDALANHIHVCSDEFAEVRDIVHETDACRKHGVCRVLNHFGTRNVRKDYAEIVQHHRAVKAGHEFLGLFTLDSNDNSVGLHEVRNGRAFLQELRITRHIERNIHASLVQLFLNNSLYFFRCSHGDRRLGHKHRIFFDILAECAGNGKHILQVCGTVFVGRRSHSAKDHFNIVKNTRQVGRKMQTAFALVSQNHFIKARLINRDFSFLEGVYFSLIHINTSDIYTHFSKACAANKADISCSNNRNIHFLSNTFYYSTFENDSFSFPNQPFPHKFYWEIEARPQIALTGMFFLKHAI